jgi:hypothetical protein
MVYLLLDLKTRRTLAHFPVSAFGTSRGALHMAHIQAHRHAFGGRSVLLTGGDEPVVYLAPGENRKSLPEDLTRCEVRPARSTRRTARPIAREQLSLPLELAGADDAAVKRTG